MGFVKRIWKAWNIIDSIWSAWERLPNLGKAGIGLVVSVAMPAAAAWVAIVLEAAEANWRGFFFVALPIMGLETVAFFVSRRRGDAGGNGGLHKAQLQPAIQKSNSLARPRVRRKVHLGLAWEDTGGNYIRGGPMAEGPLCPDDYSRLRYRLADGATRELTDQDRTWNRHSARLFCVGCGKEFILPEGKTVGMAREDVESIFDGWRREERAGTIVLR